MQFHLNGFQPGDPDKHAAGDQSTRAHVLPGETDVLIVGCGPAGLCLAAQLAAYPEISSVIVEKKSGPMEKGQADGLNVRSMEMFQAFGFAQKVMRESLWINETTFWAPMREDPAKIHRVGRVQDVEDGLSEMPHVLLNQGRVHDMFLDLMKNAATGLEPFYDHGFETLTIDADASDYPVRAVLSCTDENGEAQEKTLKARYVVGCDGARSNVRKAIGGELHGDSANQAWGVMDVLAVTDFPDIRMKSIIQSHKDGNILVLPREGGYLVRLYVELDKLNENERVANRDFTVDHMISAANRIFSPFSIDVKDVVWWSIYEIGHRLTDKFDDVPSDQTATRTPRVFTAGDACHTHSPKAGQGMNVSMGDTFNLGWKLISVLTGRAAPDLLHSYSDERRDAARGLVEFDHTWSRVVGASGESASTQSGDMPHFQRAFINNGRFTAGLTIKYQPSTLTGDATGQALATGFDIGMRFHSSPVVRLADAMPMHLGHAARADASWRIILFAPAKDPLSVDGSFQKLCDFLEADPASPLKLYTPAGADPDAVINLHAVFQQHFRDVEIGDLPAVLLPRKGRFGLIDYENVFCADHRDEQDIFDLRGVDRDKGCVVIVRPDQHVANILPLEDHKGLAEYFANILLPVADK